jgi:hypothetical protein
VHLQVPRNRGRNTTLLASITLLGGMGETMAVEGSTNQEVFEAYLERVLAPTLEEAGQMVIMDNLSAHKPARVRELIEGRGLRVSLLTRLLTGVQSDRRSFQQDQGYAAPSRSPYQGRFEIEVLGEALSTVSAQDAQGYFKHAGYRPQAQLL